MAKYESSVKQINYSQQMVYNTLSDLSNMQRMASAIPADTAKNVTFEKDCVTANIDGLGSVTLNVVNRTEPKEIKFETANTPVPLNLWIQILPVTDASCKMKLTIKADVPIFLKMMVDKQIKEAVEKLADTLAILPYSAFQA